LPVINNFHVTWTETCDDNNVQNEHDDDDDDDSREADNGPIFYW